MSRSLLTRIIERPPGLFRKTVPGGIFRIPTRQKRVYLTFDDGPIPEVTPMVLDILDRFEAKATFFMVGQNVQRHPELLQEVLRRGHHVGNHTMHHLQGMKVRTRNYLKDIAAADALIHSPLFRPPHGWLRIRQALKLRRRYHIVMYDLVTRDYSRHADADTVVDNVRTLTRPGSIIVFHDSLKSRPLLPDALVRSLQWLKDEGYEFGLILDHTGDAGR